MSPSRAPWPAWAAAALLLAGGCTEPPPAPPPQQTAADRGTPAPMDVGSDSTGPGDGSMDVLAADGGPSADADLMDRGLTDAAPEPDDAARPDQGPSRPNGPISGAYINELRFETAEEAGADIDGDGDGDNRLGVLLESVRLLLPELDANVKLRAAIGEGALRVGLHWNGLDAEQLLDGDAFEVGIIDFEAGPGYVPTRRSMEADGSPRARFVEAAIEGGILRARARQMRLVFTIWDIPVAFDVAHASLSGMVVPFIDGVGLRDGRLTGGVTIESIARFLNDFVAAPGCACLGLEGPLIVLDRGVADACSVPIDASGCGDDQTSCRFFAERCRIIVPMFTGNADVDSDGDGQNDALGVDLIIQALGVALGQ